MAVANFKGLPVGPWRTNVKTSHWLPVKTFVTYDDDTGNERILLMQHMQAVLQQVATDLKEHKIEIVNAQCGNMFDPRSFETVYKLAVGFGSREDLVMAKLVLKCEEYD